MTFLSIFHSKSEHNYPGYDNPEFDALLDGINKEADRDKRNALMAKAEGMLNRDVPALPIYFYTRSYLLKNFVRGVKPQIQDHHLLKYISIDG